MVMKILLTTSRNPTSRVRTFCNDLTSVIPDMVRVNRGKMSMNEVAEKALEEGANRVVIVDRWQGGPGKIEFFTINASGLTTVPPSLHIAGMRLQREFAPTKFKPVRSLGIIKSVNNSTRLADSLSRFFGIPVLFEKEALSKYPVGMRISRDEFGRVQITFIQFPQKIEIGPRVTLRQVVWEPT